jgi:hypothetical protein
MRWKEPCYGGTDVMERSCAVARGKDINKAHCTRIPNGYLLDIENRKLYCAVRELDKNIWLIPILRDRDLI